MTNPTCPQRRTPRGARRSGPAFNDGDPGAFGIGVGIGVGIGFGIGVGGSEDKARIEPFEAIELDLSLLWLKETQATE